MDDRQARECVGRVEALLEDAERLPDEAGREVALGLVQALLDLYGEGLERIVGHVARSDDGTLAAAFADDELLAHLLFLHGIHPVPLEARVRAALHEVRPYLESHGGDVELLAVQDGVARLRLHGSCSGCPSSTATLKLAIEDAIHRAAPDIDRVEAEGAVEPVTASANGHGHGGGSGLIQLAIAPALQEPARANRAWSVAEGLPELGEDVTDVREIDGEQVLFLALEGRRLAYRSVCPGCGTSLAGGSLHGRELACPGCGTRFDVRRAGRGLDAPGLQLEPVPLLVDHEGRVKVALGAPA